MPSPSGYQVVRLPSGAHSIRSVVHGETMHPDPGPAVEAETLYVRQLGLEDRIRRHEGEFVIWDVGLGAGANALAVLRASRRAGGNLRLISFDQTLEPLRLAWGERERLGYFGEDAAVVGRLLSEGSAAGDPPGQQLTWELCLGDFPSWLGRGPGVGFPRPHQILFDPWSPAVNPAMWTAGLFAELHGILEPACPCVLATYSRSTMLRVSLLLAGFTVGRGEAAGRKEETTIASNVAERVAAPLDRRWLERARRSHCAEPLWEAIYRRSPLSLATWERLRRHPQFR